MCSTPRAARKEEAKSTFSPQISCSHIHVCCLGHAASAGEAVRHQDGSCLHSLATFGRHLTRSHVGGVQKGLCTWLFRDLWVLRGSSALIQFIPWTPKSLEPLSRMEAAASAALPSLRSPSTNSCVYSSYEHHNLVL